MKIKLLFLLLLLFTLVLCSCDEDGKKTKYETINLNIYNWGQYISDENDEESGLFDVNAAFEEYFNENLADKYQCYIKINYTTYSNNEEMYEKLANSAVSYDIVIPSDYTIQKMIENKMLLPLDFSIITNYGNIRDEFKELYYDPSNTYSVPYSYGMVGIIYNSEFVDEADIYDENGQKSWDLMWNSKYAGKILQFNNPRDAFATAMFKEGLNINSHNPADWQRALELLIEQKPLLQAYVNDEIFNKMKGANAYISSYYAGDFLTMVADNNDLRFYYPENGTNYFVDAFCIPNTTSERKYPLANEYINYMIGRDAATANALYIGYASPNKAVVESEYYLEMLDYNYSIYESDEEDAACLVDAYEILYGMSKDDFADAYPYNPAYENYYKDEHVDIQEHVMALWESLKTENSTENWIHVTSGLIIIGVLGFAIRSSYIRKKRSKFYRDRDRELKKQRQMKK